MSAPVWGEVVNASGQVTLSTSFRLRTVDEQDEAFFALLANQIDSGARLSAANFAGGYLRVYVPVPSRSGQDLGGILALDVNLLAFNGPLAQVSDSVSNLYSPERAALLVNSRGQQIASSDIDRDFDAVRQFLGQTPGVLTNVALGSLQLSTLDIAPYTGTDLPWRLVLIDDFNVQLADANALSVTLLFVVLVFGALLLTVLDRVLFASLRPLESAVSAAANRLVTSEVPRVRLAQTDTSEILLADGAGSSDAQVESLMGAIDVATQRIAGLANELDAQTRRRARDIEVASRIGRATAQLVEIDPLVNRAIQFIVAELEVYHAQVFLLDDLGINAILSYSYGEPGRKLLEAGHRLRVGSETVVGRASGSARTIVVNDTRDPQARHGFNALLPETRAELALPLIVGDQVIGVLDIQSAKAGFFIDEDLAVYELLADQLAVAINKARLLRQSDERIAQVEAFNRQMTARAWEEFEDPASNQMAYTYNLTEVKPVTQPRSGLTSQRSLNMPINVRGEVIGEISAELAPDEAMTENQRNLMRAVAERVSLAIENARLFTESRTALSETQTLYRLSRMLNEANTLEGILTAVNVVVMPNSHRALMWLFNEPVRDEALPGDAVLRADYINPSRVANPQQTVSLVGIEYDFSAFPFLHRFDFSSVAVLEDTATDLRLDPSTRALLTNIGIAAAVFVPLVIRDEWLGMALFGFAQPYAFPQVESRVFQPLINPLSIAANNRLLVERNEQFSARTAILYNASRAINSATSHADLVAAAINTTDSTEMTFSLALLDGEPDEAGWPGYQRVVGYSENYAVQTLNFRHRIRVAAQSPLRQRNPEIITDATGAQADVAMRLPWLPNAHNVRFMAVYPLFSGAVPIALLYISSGVPRQISEDEDSIYRAITGQMSTQLQNRQLLEQTAEALEETRLLYIATRAITSAQTQDAVFFAAADHMARPALAASAEGTPIDLRIMIWLARPDPAANPDLLEMAYEFSNTQQPSRILDDGQRLFWTGDELPLWRALGNQSSVVLNVTDAIDPSTPQGVVANQLHANGAAAALIAAVASRDYWFGAVVVHTDRPELLTERYANFVQATAGQLALALENKLLLDQSEASANENVALYRTSRALANVNNVRDVLRVLRDTVANFDIHHIFIADLETNRWDSAGATIRVVAEWTADGQPLVMDAIMSENEMPAWPLLASPDVLMMGDRESEEAQAVLAAMGADSLALSVLDARALVVLPLRVQDRILGVAWVSSAQPITFTDRN
nr:GAF domain-containing protein [Anaerolineae bacterium]